MSDIRKKITLGETIRIEINVDMDIPHWLRGKIVEDIKEIVEDTYTDTIAFYAEFSVSYLWGEHDLDNRIEAIKDEMASIIEKEMAEPREKDEEESERAYTPENPMTDKEYRDHGANCCPYCGSENIEGDGQIEADSSQAWQDVTCSDCEETWQDVYELVGYEEK